MSGRDTIYALSSGRPPAAIAVVRISGPRAAAALEMLTGKMPVPRQAALVSVRDPQSETAIDQSLALWFPGPASETGEDVAELQLHGGRAVIAATLAALSRIDGLRPAEAGEFTRRAFENGKLDLTGVEGLADLVMAETEAQRRQALRQSRGLLGNRAESWRRQIIQTLALTEAAIDFSDEADVPATVLEPAFEIARELESDIGRSLADQGLGERLRDGLVVAIAGPPNAGKSTLLNRIARREVAIVSPYAGTTRDVIEVHLDLCGLPMTLVDTAGIRDSEDPVEMEGVRRARDRAAAADLVLWLEDATRPLTEQPERPAAAMAWRVTNKVDLVPYKNEPISTVSASNELNNQTNKVLKNTANKRSFSSNEQVFTRYDLEFNLSAKTGEGFEALLTALSNFAGNYLAGAEQAVVTRDRHRRALQDARSALQRALAEPPGREDVVAEELRLAARALGRLTGRVDVEDVLDVIFREFCIGK